ncbi:MAG: hypothetical protein FRX49_10990 [Trebouxia sp. A1-2]|nr:MAG: hypothetical protein FRX49_10990 [Trebouxia sp. A1-2]
MSDPRSGSTVWEEAGPRGPWLCPRVLREGPAMGPKGPRNTTKEKSASRTVPAPAACLAFLRALAGGPDDSLPGGRQEKIDCMRRISGSMHSFANPYFGAVWAGK